MNLHEIKGDLNILDNFDKMIYFLDEPQADIAPMHVYNICKYANELDYKVLIGGAGGDDLFSGYRRHQAINIDTLLLGMPKLLNKVLSKVGRLPLNNIPLIRRLNKYLKYVDKPLLSKMCGYYEWIPYEINKGLFNNEIAKKLENHHPSKILKSALSGISNENNPLNMMLFLEIIFF